MRNSSAVRRKRKQTKATRLKNKTVVLGVSGSVAAYKSVELVRRLKDEGAAVNVVMTEAAHWFVTPLSLEVASQNNVLTSLFDNPMAHIRLPESADVFVVAPATADIIGKIAGGMADDLLTTCLLAYEGPVLIAPAMNRTMYENRIFQENLEKLRVHGVIQIGPEEGSLACGHEGIGRMAEVWRIVDAVVSALQQKDLAGERIVVTAGPTREYIDPVRFISNRSSGRMGFAIARAARDRGASVTLISGPTVLEKPEGVRCVDVETAEEMSAAVDEEVNHAPTVLIMAAAVSDFAPPVTAGTKIEKEEEMTLVLKKTRDIIAGVAGRVERPFLIGFAAETGPRFERAEEKMRRKGLDMIVFNDVTEAGSGFDTDTNRVVIMDKTGRKDTGLVTKEEVAHAILDRFLERKA